MHGDGGRNGPGVIAGGNNAIGSRSDSTAPIELKAIDPPPPPHRSPTSAAVVAVEPVPGGIVKTGAPLSPPAEPALARVVQSATKVVPSWVVLAHVVVIGPPVHPVVLPTLITTVPASGRGAVPVIVRMDVALGIVIGQVAGTMPVGDVRHNVEGRAIASISPF